MSWFRREGECLCCERVERTLSQMQRELREIRAENHTIGDQLRTQRMLLYDILADVRIAVGLLTPRLRRIVIVQSGGPPMPLEVGKTAVATVNGFDQFGQPFPIDFNANVPSWTVSDPALATIAPDATTLGSEDVTGAAAGSETLSVAVAGLTTSVTFDIVAPAPVLTSVTITTNPAV